MRFPIIKVHDKANLNVQFRIVGTNSHDQLLIDANTGAIKYYNLQNGEGTGGDYRFVGTDDEYCECIEFVTFEELVEIYIQQAELLCDQEQKARHLVKHIREMHQKMIEEKGLQDGPAHTAGILYEP